MEGLSRSTDKLSEPRVGESPPCETNATVLKSRACPPPKKKVEILQKSKKRKEKKERKRKNKKEKKNRQPGLFSVVSFFFHQESQS